MGPLVIHTKKEIPQRIDGQCPTVVAPVAPERQRGILDSTSTMALPTSNGPKKLNSPHFVADFPWN
jgi:hypothetical protein